MVGAIVKDRTGARRRHFSRFGIGGAEVSRETSSLSRTAELLSCRIAECRIVYELARGIRIELPLQADETAC